MCTFPIIYSHDIHESCTYQYIVITKKCTVYNNIVYLILCLSHLIGDFFQIGSINKQCDLMKKFKTAMWFIIR